MEINKNMSGSELTVKLEGRLDTTTAPELEQSLKDDLEKIDSLVIDFEKLEYISSAGLRVLLSTKKAMTGRGNMVVRNVNETILEVFEMTGFNDILNVE